MKMKILDGLVAQSVEQRIENPCVGGSIPPRATKYRSPTVLGWASSFVPSPVFAGLPAICVCQTVLATKGTFAVISYVLPLLLELLQRTLSIWHTQNAFISNNLYVCRIEWFLMLIAEANHSETKNPPIKGSAVQPFFCTGKTSSV